MKLHDVLAFRIYAGGPGSGCHGPNCGRPEGSGGKWSRDSYDLEEILDEAHGQGGREAVEKLLEDHDGWDTALPGKHLWVLPNESMVVDIDEHGAYVNDLDSEWIYRQNIDEFYPNYADDKNKELWSSPPVLYHATPDENAASIMKTGLEPRGATRGMSNRSVGSAVFTTSEVGDLEDGAYGDTIFEIDLGQMKEDYAKEGKDLPFLEEEPDVAERETRMALAHAVGLDDFEPEVEQGMSPYTIIVNGFIPAKYLRKL